MSTSMVYLGQHKVLLLTIQLLSQMVVPQLAIGMVRLVELVIIFKVPLVLEKLWLVIVVLVIRGMLNVLTLTHRRIVIGVRPMKIGILISMSTVLKPFVGA